MKKISLCILAFCLSFFFVSCAGDTTTQEITLIEDLTSETSTEEVILTTTEETYHMTLVVDGLPNEVISGITDGMSVTLVEPSKEGYTFDGWYLEETLVTSPFNYDYTNDITLTARFTINTYLVEFFDYDGTLLGYGNYNHGSSAIAPTTPVRTGCVFAGWSVDFDNVTEPLSVTAVYDIGVFFYNYDGTLLSTDYVEYGEAATAPVNPTRTGYTFSSWDVAFDNVTDVLEVTAEYTINQYTVTFNDYDGSVLKTESVDYLTDATAPSNPERTGYTFIGWSVSFDAVTADLTVTAEYEINQYTVTFYNWDGTVYTSDIYDYGDQAVLPSDPSRTGHTFTGWDTDASFITQDLMVNPVFTVNQYTITFNVEGGTPMTSITANYGSVVTLPDAEKADHYFLYWEAEDQVDTEFTILGDVTLTAIYKDVLSDFTYTTSGLSLTITGYTGSETDIIIPDSYDVYDIDYISGNAFLNHTTIEKVTIGVNVYQIGANAFNGCSNLEEVILKDNNSLHIIDESAFNNCTSLRKINIEACVDLMFIGPYSFLNCNSLKYIYLSDTVETIGSYAFDNCSSLFIYARDASEQLNWTMFWNYDNRPVSYTTEGIYEFEDFRYVLFLNNDLSIMGFVDDVTVTTLVIPEMIGTIPVLGIQPFAFYQNTDLTHVTIGSNVLHIGYYAFSDCVNITEVLLSSDSDLEYISSYAFNHMTSLEKINLEDCHSLDTIGVYAFQNCTSLLELHLNTSVTTIETSITLGATKVSVFVYAASVPATWNSNWNSGYSAVVYDFDYKLTENNLLFAVRNDGKVVLYGVDPDASVSILVIPNAVTGVGFVEYIADCAFAQDPTIISVLMGPFVKEIGEYAFFDIDNLSSMTMPNGSLLETIHYRAFYQCRDLTSVNLEECTSLTTIETGAFSTTGLTSIKVPISVTTIENYAFSGSLNITIYCEIDVKPSGWETSWNFNGYPVVWDYLNV